MRQPILNCNNRLTAVLLVLAALALPNCLIAAEPPSSHARAPPDPAVEAPGFSLADMETLFDARVMLRLWVKVRSGWRESEQVLGEMGLGDKP